MYAIYHIFGTDEIGYSTLCYRKNLDEEGLKKHIAIIKGWKHRSGQGKYAIVKMENIERFQSKWQAKNRELMETWKTQEKKAYKVDINAYKDIMENR